MKNSILIIVAFLAFSLNAFAQSSIQFNVHHKLGDTDFAFEMASVNNINHDFKLTRLQYYISEITITHDGGLETPMENLWILVNAGELTQVDLGMHDINEVEKIAFSIGVDEDHNHLDPASYQTSHPLAPQFPSMHWGWAAGYRFVALEGNAGSNFNQVIELHGLEDKNYFQVEKELNLSAENNEIVFDFEADYSRALENISVNSGIIVHSGDDEAAQCLENFRDYVFTIDGEITSSIDISEVSNFEVFPNPTNSKSTIVLETTRDLTYQISVTNILGNQILFFDEIRSNSTIDLNLDHAGLYFVNLIKEGQPVISNKLLVK